MIKSTITPSNDIIVALMNYTVDVAEEMFGKYGFGYLNLDHKVLAKIEESGVKASQSKGFVGFIPLDAPITLLDTSTINDYTHSQMAGFEHFKLDSITYLALSPDLTGYSKKEAKGYVVCANQYFYIGCELKPEKTNFSTIIYRSAQFPYEKLLWLV